MKDRQLELPMDIPIAGEASRERIRERMDAAERRSLPEGSTIKTKMIYIKNFLK